MADVIGAPIQQVMGGADPFAGVQKVLIKQEIAAIEMCSIEAKQRYRVSQPGGHSGREETQVFLYVTEESNCLERICCSVNRALTLKIHQGNNKEGPVVTRMKKPFHIQGCCVCRPSFDVTTGGNDKIGRIEDPCRCCTLDNQIYDRSGKLSFKTVGGCCQIGIFCPLCFPINFDMMDPSDKKIGKIEKVQPNLTECCCDVNRFLVDFGDTQDGEKKQMMFASAMLLDLQYFETQK